MRRLEQKCDPGLKGLRWSLLKSREIQAAKRKARGYGRFRTIRTVIFLIAGKLDFSKLNPYVALSA